MTIVEDNDNEHEWDFEGIKKKLGHELIKVKKCCN
jgi:hypothetical protein